MRVLLQFKAMKVDDLAEVKVDDRLHRQHLWLVWFVWGLVEGRGFETEKCILYMYNLDSINL